MTQDNEMTLRFSCPLIKSCRSPATLTSTHLGRAALTGHRHCSAGTDGSQSLRYAPQSRRDRDTRGRGLSRLKPVPREQQPLPIRSKPPAEDPSHGSEPSCDWAAIPLKLTHKHIAGVKHSSRCIKLKMNLSVLSTEV